MNKSSKPLESQSPDGVQVHRGDGKSDDRPAPIVRPLAEGDPFNKDGSARPGMMISSNVVDREDLKDLHEIIEKNAERSEKQYDAMLAYNNNLNTENVKMRGDIETLNNRVGMLTLCLILLLLVGLTILVLTTGFPFPRVP